MEQKTIGRSDPKKSERKTNWIRGRNKRHVNVNEISTIAKSDDAQFTQKNTSAKVRTSLTDDAKKNQTAKFLDLRTDPQSFTTLPPLS